MGKLDELMKAHGNHAAESVSRRDSGAAIHRESPPVSGTPDRLAGVVRSKAAAEIPLEKIVRDPGQPREDFDEEGLARLAESIRGRGLLQPVRVRWDEGQGSYVLVCGERRWRAAKLAGLATLPCTIAQGTPDASELLMDQLIENLLRSDLKPVEQARSFRALMEAKGWSTRELARELSISQPTVVRALALLDLPADVQERVEEGSIPAAAAYQVAQLADAESQREIAAQVVAEGLSVAETAEVVRRRSPRPAAGPKGRGAKVRKVTERVLRTSTGYRITVQCRRGVEPAGLVAALREALERVESEVRGADAA